MFMPPVKSKRVVVMKKDSVAPAQNSWKLLME